MSLVASVLRPLGTLTLLVFAGCSTLIAPPNVEPSSDPNRTWGDVLSTHVDDEGRVDFAGVSNDRAALESYVSYVSRTDPAALPEGPERLAFYINSYNALAMYGVIKNDIPAALDSDVKRAKFFYLTEYMVGGKSLSLYEYENNVIRKLGEPKVHFALNCMSVGCPRLPDEPYIASDLEEQLQDGAMAFFNSDKYVQVDSVNRTVKLSEILKFYTDDFVNPQQSPSLVEYVNRFREEKIPLDYTVDFIPYDWTINKQP